MIAIRNSPFAIYDEHIHRVVINIGLFALVLCLSLVLAELAWRLTMESGNERRIFHAELGTINPPGEEWIAHNPEYRVHVRTNSHGFRDDEWPEEQDRSEVRIVFIGDSFLEAKQVEEVERFAEMTAAQLSEAWTKPVRPIVLGMGGSSPTEELLFYRHLGRTLHPTIVVQVLFLENDIPAMEEKGRHVAHRIDRAEDGTLSIEMWTVPPDPCTFKCQILMRSRIALRIYQLLRSHAQSTQGTNEDLRRISQYWYTVPGLEAIERENRMAALVAIVGETKREVEADGARYLAVLMPSAFEIEDEWRDTFLREQHIAEEEIDTEELLSLVERTLVSEEIDVLNLRERFQESKSQEPLYYRLDPHLTPFGHRVVTEEITERLREKP